MGEERRRRRRWDDGRFSTGCIVKAMGIDLSLAVVVGILLLSYAVFSLVGFIALAASVSIRVFEGVRYLSKRDGQFYREYVASRRLWF